MKSIIDEINEEIKNETKLLKPKIINEVHK